MSNRLMVAALALCASLIAAGISGGAMYLKGRADGRLQVQAAQDSQTVSALTTLLEQHQQQIAEANAASLRINGLLADRQAYDRETTKTLKELLDETAAMRGECRFDDRVMRALTDARERAAKAAAGGFDGAVPITGSPDG